MKFGSDNHGPVHPKILEGIAGANNGFSKPYGTDTLTAEMTERVRDVFDAPDAAVFLTPTGGSTNGLILSTLSQPWEEIYCARANHIRVDECNGVEFFTGGSRVTYVSDGDTFTADDLTRALEETAPGNVHRAQPGPVSITQVADFGSVYSIKDIASVTTVAKGAGLKTHLDGARFANAMVALACSASEMSWRSGVDTVSFGGTKNGCMGVELAIFFDPDQTEGFEYRRKRAGHLFSKSRFLAAQMLAYLEGDLWLELAGLANASASKLFAGLQDRGGRMLVEPAANLGFVWLPRAFHKRALGGGCLYEVMGSLEGDPEEEILSRFVCDWSIGTDGVEAFFNVVDG